MRDAAIESAITPAAVTVPCVFPRASARACASTSECVNVNYNNRAHASRARHQPGLLASGRVLKSVFNCAIYVCARVCCLTRSTDDRFAQAHAQSGRIYGNRCAGVLGVSRCCRRAQREMIYTKAQSATATTAVTHTYTHACIQNNRVHSTRMFLAHRQ